MQSTWRMEDMQEEKKLEPIGNIFQRLGKELLQAHSSNPEMHEKLRQILEDQPKPQEATEEGKSEYQEMIRRSLQMKANLYNASSGSLNLDDGIDCPICKNKGFTEKVILGFGGSYASTLVKCECQKRRTSWRKLKNSGLSGSIERLTFDSFKDEQDWQKKIKTKAEKFAQSDGEEWFFFGGSVGCGKTHICTAICGEMLKKNKSVKYMLWSEESVKLKGKVNDDNYEDLIRVYKEVDVLYIDDFFKVKRDRSGNAGYPSDADLKLAYQIINKRYVERKKTIISSEWLMNELMDFDEAIASRIYEMSRGNTLQIARNEERNYRRRDAV